MVASEPRKRPAGTRTEGGGGGEWAALVGQRSCCSIDGHDKWAPKSSLSGTNHAYKLAPISRLPAGIIKFLRAGWLVGLLAERQ